jgi:hypothetical protein
VRGDALRIGVGEAIGHHVQPYVELLVAARPDLDPRWRHSLALALDGNAEYVLERHQPVAPFRQQGADRRVAEVRQLDLHGPAACSESPLDLAQGSRARHTPEAETRDLVKRRAGLSEARLRRSGSRIPGLSALRRRAALLASPISCTSTRSIRSARTVSQKGAIGRRASTKPRADSLPETKRLWRRLWSIAGGMIGAGHSAPLHHQRGGSDYTSPPTT